MLDELNDVARMAQELESWDPRYGGTFIGGEMYCPKCGDRRRMFVHSIHRARQPINRAAWVPPQLVSSLYGYTCVQCETKFTALVYEGPDGPALAVLQSCRGGLTTSNTPRGVAYYLDQAQRCQSVTAYNAAIAMFRAALDHLLFEQGYKVGMLGAKISKLEADIAAGTSPKWATELDTQFLGILKDLGNASIHPNDGNVDRQSALHSQLIAAVKQTFMALLVIVYEAPAFKAAKLAELQRAKALITTR